MSASWTFWAVLSAVFAAMTAILGKLGVQDINSNLATLIRTGVILVLAAGVSGVTGSYQGLGSANWRTWLFLLLSGLATGASWLCYYHALQLGPASKVAPIDKLSVVLVSIFAVLFLREQLSPREWVGVALIGAGAVVIAL